MLQMPVVPLLALAGTWQVAAVLIIVERIGKRIRNPPRRVLRGQPAGRYPLILIVRKHTRPAAISRP